MGRREKLSIIASDHDMEVIRIIDRLALEIFIVASDAAAEQPRAQAGATGRALKRVVTLVPPRSGFGPLRRGVNPVFDRRRGEGITLGDSGCGADRRGQLPDPPPLGPEHGSGIVAGKGTVEWKIPVFPTIWMAGSPNSVFDFRHLRQGRGRCAQQQQADQGNPQTRAAPSMICQSHCSDLLQVNSQIVE
jgi:hypothetical protein